MDAMGILPRFCGVAIHDFWKPYPGFGSCRHVFCGAHLLRELEGVKEKDRVQWPEAMAELRKLPFAYSEAEEAGKKLRVSPEHSVADVAAVRREWMNSARAQYRRAARLAKEGKKPRGAQEKK